MKRALLALALALASCRPRAEGVVKEAEFGVFFGGQVQELKEIEKELDAARQVHGFRLTFREPLTQELPISWEVSLPVPEKGGPRPAIVGETKAKVGQALLDVPLAFRPSDPLGVWHVKVVAGGSVVVDRDFTLVAPAPGPRAPNKPLPPRGPAGE